MLLRNNVEISDQQRDQYGSSQVHATGQVEHQNQGEKLPAEGRTTIRTSTRYGK